MNVGVVGAGQMGSGIAQVFAQRRYDVTMVVHALPSIPLLPPACAEAMSTKRQGERYEHNRL